VQARQAAFFTTLFAMLGKMAKADGRVSEDEVEVVERFMRENLGLSTESRRLAIRVFNEAKENDVPFEAYARQFGEMFAGAPDLRQMLYELLYSLAVADGRFHPEEDRLLREALGPLQLPGSLYDRLRGRLRIPDLDRYYALLGVQAEASDEEIKQAYRRAAREHHPDMVISRGLPEEFAQVAGEKFKEINEAYEAITRHRAPG
jgi:DnaJ like chaperone protein